MKITKAVIAILLMTVCIPFLAKSQPTVNQPRLIIPFGHQNGILHTLFSNDNKMLITADDKMTIVSDVRSGKPLYYLQGTLPAISAKDDLIATVVDSMVMVWDAGNGLPANSIRFTSTVAHIAFHPTTNLLMIERLAGDENKSNYYHAAVWDPKQKTIQHESLSDAKANGTGSDACETCKRSSCPIIAAWFTNKGDSLRIIHPGLIKTYAIGNYQNASNACLAIADKNFSAADIRILNNHTIGVYQEKAVNFFNEYGQWVSSWTKKTTTEGPALQVTECISPGHEYLASYTSQTIYLYNLKAGTLKYYNVDRGHVKKLSFNSAGTLLLVEFLNETPRIMTSNFTVPKTFKPSDYEGFPKYVYETKTVRDVVEMTDGFQSPAPAQKPARRTWFNRVLTDGLGMPDPYSYTNGIMSIMVNGINIANTNSGEIIDLATRRPISKILSLIKMTGDLRMSPDGNLMLLNTGQKISVYSIPYSKILVNLYASMFDDYEFSADSRWLVQNIGGMFLNMVNLNTGMVDTLSLNMPFSLNSKLAFLPNSREVVISSENGGSIIVDITTKKIVKKFTYQNSFQAADGLKYGVIDNKDHIAHIYSTKDSVKLYSISLAAVTGVKSNKNKDKKENRNEQPAEELGAELFRIGFGASSDAFAIWHNNRVLFVKDINKPADTVLFEGEMESPILRVTISANNKYLNIKPYEGNNIIFNVNSKEVFKPVLAEKKEADVFNMATLFKSMLSMGLENTLRGRDIVQFSVTGDSALTYINNAVYVYDCATGKMLNSFKAEGDIKYLNAAGNLLVSNFYGQLKFYTLQNMKEWLSMIPFTNGEMVFLLPNGIYSGNKSATRYLGYMQDAKSLSYKQFDLSNNRPDSVVRALGNTDVKYLALIDSMVAMRRRREGVRAVASSITAKAPQVFITNEKDIAGEVKQSELSLKLSIKTYQQYPGKLALYINGNPMGGPKGIRLSRKYSIDTTVQVSLTQGKNNIEVSVFDASGAESYRQPLVVEYAPDSAVGRKLYFLGFGVSQYQASGNNLVYAQKDVRDVLDSLRRQYGDQMVVDTFFNQHALADSLRNLKSKFKKTKPDDIVVVYYSGHGIIDGNRPEVYFGTYDVDFNKPSVRGISINDLNELLEYIPARNKVIFLDACHSGDLNKETATRMRKPGETDPFDLMLDMFTDHYQGNGNNILVAARGKEAAKECDSIRLGIFTYTVLKGLAFMKADEDSNAVLTIGELQNYITRNVINNSIICRPKVMQRAGIRKENEYNDWAVLRNNKATYGLRSTITETTQPRSLVSQVQTTRDTLGFYANQGKVIFGGGSSLEDRGKAVISVVERNIPSFLKRKDNVAYLQQYQRQRYKHDSLLANEQGFNVRYEKVKRKDGEYIIFNVTCKYVIPNLRVDVNANKELNACEDKVYTKTEKDVVQVKFMLAGAACDGKEPETGAAMYATADQYLFMVPVNELTKIKGIARVNFMLQNNVGKDPVYWPAECATSNFESYYEAKW